MLVVSPLLRQLGIASDELYSVLLGVKYSPSQYQIGSVECILEFATQNNNSTTQNNNSTTRECNSTIQQFNNSTIQQFNNSTAHCPFLPLGKIGGWSRARRPVPHQENRKSVDRLECRARALRIQSCTRRHPHWPPQRGRGRTLCRRKDFTASTTASPYGISVDRPVFFWKCTYKHERQ